MRPAVEEYIFYRGKKLRVEFYFTDEGRMPAKELLERIAEQKVTFKLAASVTWLADAGILYDERRYRIVERKHRIYEFKTAAYRFFNFFSSSGKLIIINGYMKKSKKIDKKELSRAVKLKKDYLERVEKGAYYEKE